MEEIFCILIYLSIIAKQALIAFMLHFGDTNNVHARGYYFDDAEKKAPQCLFRSYCDSNLFGNLAEAL
jgi:hypothetical protein